VKATLKENKRRTKSVSQQKDVWRNPTRTAHCVALSSWLAFVVRMRDVPYFRCRPIAVTQAPPSQSDLDDVPRAYCNLNVTYSRFTHATCTFFTKTGIVHLRTSVVLSVPHFALVYTHVCLLMICYFSQTWYIICTRWSRRTSVAGSPSRSLDQNRSVSSASARPWTRPSRMSSTRSRPPAREGRTSPIFYFVLRFFMSLDLCVLVLSGRC
jgi:hypothetical protein